MDKRNRLAWYESYIYNRIKTRWSDNTKKHLLFFKQALHECNIRTKKGNKENNKNGN